MKRLALVVFPLLFTFAVMWPRSGAAPIFAQSSSVHHSQGPFLAPHPDAPEPSVEHPVSPHAPALGLTLAVDPKDYALGQILQGGVTVTNPTVAAVSASFLVELFQTNTLKWQRSIHSISIAPGTHKFTLADLLGGPPMIPHDRTELLGTWKLKITQLGAKPEASAEASFQIATISGKASTPPAARQPITEKPGICTPTTGKIAERIYGIGFQNGSLNSLPSLRRPDPRIFTLLEELSIKWVRIPFQWDVLEPEDGKFAWSLYDPLVSELGKRGINILATINNRPPWILRMATADAEQKGREGFGTLLLQKGYSDAETSEAREHYRSYVLNTQDPGVKKWFDSLTPKKKSDVADAFDRALKLYYSPTFNASRDWEMAYSRMERFSKELANRYKPGGLLAQKNKWSDYGIRYWEVWNEPNFPCCGWITLFADPERYAAVLAVVHRGIRSSDRSAVILFGGLSPDGYPPEEFTQKVYATGKKDCFDLLNFHPYVAVQDYPKWAAAFQKLAAANGDAGKPVWFTERGYTTATAGPNKEIEENVQARNLKEAYTFFAQGGVPAFFWYSLEEGPDEPGNPGTYGILRRDFSKKPAFDALKNLLRQAR